MINPIINSSKYVIFSVVGTHANEEIGHIFARKIAEIRRFGKTYWAYRSSIANPKAVQKFGLKAEKEKKAVVCLFIGASSEGVTKPTKGSQKALWHSLNKKDWLRIPNDNLITGSNRSSFALVLNKIDLMDNAYIDLWRYSQNNNPEKAVRIMLGSSTICCLKHSSENDPSKMKSRYRRVLAVGTLVSPYGVWLKY